MKEERLMVGRPIIFFVLVLVGASLGALLGLTGAGAFTGQEEVHSHQGLEARITALEERIQELEERPLVYAP